MGTGFCALAIPLLTQQKQGGTMKATAALFLDLALTALETKDSGTIVRIGKAQDQPVSTLDSFYPNLDLGFLWFRYVDHHLACSGMVHEEVLQEAQLHSLVDYAAAQLLGTDDQVDFQVELVRSKLTLVESGEESLRIPSSSRA
jgi:hypothetical protein